MIAAGRRERVEEVFRACAAMDLATVMAAFTEDAVLVDPHYPVVRMEGKAAIEDGLRWAFGSMSSMRFDIERYFEAPEGDGAAVEVATHHVLKVGNRHLDFPQAFVLEFDGELVRRMQAYEPYGPGGPAGVFIGLERLRRRFRRG